MPEALHLLANFSTCGLQSKLEKMLLFYLAPVLKKVKPAELVILKKSCFLSGWQEQKDLLTDEMQLSYQELTQTEDSIYILFYDEKLLGEFLLNKSCQNILHNNGYKAKRCLPELLEQLSKRVSKNLCPHEIGLFLGYPPYDVQAFIKFKGKNYCLCRHWKAYHNLDKALLKFEEIDNARQYVAVLLNKGLPFQNTVRLIKSA